MRRRADPRRAATASWSLATFRLTERPGPGSCGTGTGATAQTAFLIEDGEIVEWRRVGLGERAGAEQLRLSGCAKRLLTNGRILHRCLRS